MASETVWTMWLLRLQLGLIIVLAAGLLGHKLGIVPFRMAFPAFGLSVLLLLIAGLTALVGVVLAFILSKSAWLNPAIGATVIGLLPAIAIVLIVGPSNFGVPPIHDISTDLDNPPVFQAAKEARRPSHNSLQHGGEKVAAAQRRAYPEIEPLMVDMPPESAFERSIQVMEAMGWRLLDADENAGRIEAYDETAFFGFKDDIVIRIQPAENGSRIDLRSVSRVGQSDLGANAKRIRAFQKRFQEYQS